MSEMLKEIKKNHEQQIERMKKQVTMYQIHPSDVKWLIEQVEHLKGLEESLRQNIKIKQEGIDFLKQENERYREALERIKKKANEDYKTYSDREYNVIAYQMAEYYEELASEGLESDNE